MKRHEELVHSEMQKVISHVQRDLKEDDWVLNTLMIEGCTAPFRYKRKKRYTSLEGQRVNLTYYPDSENVAGMDVEIMKVIRVRRS